MSIQKHRRRLHLPGSSGSEISEPHPKQVRGELFSQADQRQIHLHRAKRNPITCKDGRLSYKGKAGKTSKEAPGSGEVADSGPVRNGTPWEPSAAGREAFDWFVDFMDEGMDA